MTRRALILIPKVDPELYEWRIAYQTLGQWPGPTTYADHDTVWREDAGYAPKLSFGANMDRVHLEIASSDFLDGLCS